MPDFMQTMKDWRRMCKYYASNCDRCPLCNFECGAVPRKMKYYTDDQVQAIILEWVKVHPEPVYPSWYAWLANMGIVPIELPPDQAIMVTDIGLLKKIPADLAHKLGIEPKEGA